MSASMDVDLLLIGKTGNGKSSTGNTILRRNAFRSASSTSSVTTRVDYEFSEFNGRGIKVVDGPGIGDTRMDIEASVNLVLENLEYAIAASPHGYHAFLLVVQFAGRFTEEDQQTICFLKKIFGESFVKTYCILVMTCGDHFGQDNNETGQTFEDWCSSQDGIFKELVAECDNRVILFDNRTRDETKRCAQISNLLKMVDNLRAKGNRYTDENFAMAKAAREQIIVKAKKPIIREETLRETSLILQKLQQLEMTNDFEDKIRPLEELATRVAGLLNNIASQDRGTGLLRDLRDTVTSVQETVDEEVRFCSRIKIEIEKIRKRESEKLRLTEKHREAEKEQEKKIEEAREEGERTILLKLAEKNLKWQKRFGELEERYRKLKRENDKSLFEILVSIVVWPFKKLGELFCKDKK